MELSIKYIKEGGIYYWTFIDNFTSLKSYKPHAMANRYHEVIKLDEYRKMSFKFLMLTLWKAVKMAESSVWFEFYDLGTIKLYLLHLAKKIAYKLIPVTHIWLFISNLTVSVTKNKNIYFYRRTQTKNIKHCAAKCRRTFNPLRVCVKTGLYKFPKYIDTTSKF